MGCGIISSALEGILICLDPLASVIEKRMSLTIKRFSKVFFFFFDRQIKHYIKKGTATIGHPTSTLEVYKTRQPNARTT